MAAAVGGASSAVVLASIPDSSGVIHGCYSNSKGTLSVIDTSTTNSCPVNTTALNWDQTGGSTGGVLAYAHIVYDPNAQTWTLDTSHSFNVSNLYINSQYPNDICLTANGTPKSVSLMAGYNSMTFTADIKAADGWLGGGVGLGICGPNDPAANVGVGIINSSGASGDNFYLTLF